MPLSMGMRDESNERINNLLKKLISLVFVPEGWNEGSMDEQLQALDLSVEKLRAFSGEEIGKYLMEKELDWANMEQFADFLGAISTKAGCEPLKDKAASVYHFIQAESKMFSFEIFNKIAALNK